VLKIILVNDIKFLGAAHESAAGCKCVYAECSEYV
jgi:hypothetical protein